MTISLLDETHDLLKARPIGLTYKKISLATGLSVPWLQDFVIYKRGGTSVLRLEKLKAYFDRLAALEAKRQAIADAKRQAALEAKR